MVGRIVYSAAGRDRNKLMVIVEETEKFLLVCDGKERPVERPKRKNPKHLRFTETYIEPNLFKTNRILRKTLKNFASGYKEEI